MMRQNPTSPSHYTRWAIQPLDFIARNNLDFLRGNIIKYILRFDAKDGLQDLEKARTYLERLIALEKSKPGKTDNHNNMENENHGKSKGCYLHLQGAFPFPRDQQRS